MEFMLTVHLRKIRLTNPGLNFNLAHDNTNHTDNTKVENNASIDK